MVNLLLESIKKIWDKWNIQSLILFSLSLQIILILFAPFRKSSTNKLIIFLIWSAYLLADWAANFGVGLIARNARDNRTKLLVFWAPFMLLHLGGPDSITAFALADNELWLRHLLALIFQVLGTVYIFVQMLPGNKLIIPTILLFVVGTIKYLERIRALNLASVEKFQDSLIVRKSRSVRLRKTLSDITEADRDLEDLNLAFQYFEIFKPFYIDLPDKELVIDGKACFFPDEFFTPKKESEASEKALRVIEIVLNLVYQVFYTKIQVTNSVLGTILRFMSSGSVVAALSVFYFQVEKHGFNEFDVRVTYTLLLGALAHDIIAFFMLVFSDWMFVALWNNSKKSIFGKIKNSIAGNIRRFLDLKSSRWVTCHSHSNHKVLATRLLFRRWSGTVSGLSFIRYCLEERPSRKHKVNCLQLHVIDRLVRTTLKLNQFRLVHTTLKLIQFLHFDKVIALLGPADFVDGIKIKASISHEPLTKELWVFMFSEIKRKAAGAGDWRRKCSATGDCTLREFKVGDNFIKLLEPYQHKDVSSYFIESLVLWHLATDLLYGKTAKEDFDENTSNKREISKIISDYMLYLSVSKATMTNSSKLSSRMILIYCRRYVYKCFDKSEERSFKRGPVKNACETILRSKDRASILFEDAKELIRRLEQLRDEDKMWDLVSKVWVELLSNAAMKCSGRAHVQQLSKGGELLTFVWLLWLGFIEEY